MTPQPGALFVALLVPFDVPDPKLFVGLDEDVVAADALRWADRYLRVDVIGAPARTVRRSEVLTTTFIFDGPQPRRDPNEWVDVAAVPSHSYLAGRGQLGRQDLVEQGASVVFDRCLQLHEGELGWSEPADAGDSLGLTGRVGGPQEAHS